MKIHRTENLFYQENRVMKGKMDKKMQFKEKKPYAVL